MANYVRMYLFIIRVLNCFSFSQKKKKKKKTKLLSAQPNTLPKIMYILTMVIKINEKCSEKSKLAPKKMFFFCIKIILKKLPRKGPSI